MNSINSIAVHGLVFLGGLLVSACAGYSGSNLTPGVSTLPEVMASLGQPAMAWKNPDGSEQLAYPHGPAGTQTFMAYVGADGKLQHIDGALNEQNFSLVRQGMTKEQVLRILGPSGALWTQTYSRSNTLVWSWLYCASGNFQNYFDVMFDVTTGTVRSTGQHPVLLGYGPGTPTCARQNVNVG